MDKRSLEIVRQLKKNIEKEFKVYDMRIFGSRARDDYEEDSDLDVYLKLEKSNYEIEDKIFNIVWKIGFENDLIIMTLIHSKDEVENGLYKHTLIYKSIVRDGIIV